MIYEGLSDIDAQKILIDKGYNEIPIAKKSFILSSVIKTLLEPMILILLLACGIYFFIGDLPDFLILTFSTLVIFSINIFQNYKTEESLNKLKALNKNYTEVIRGGTRKIIENRNLVEGDYVIVNEGDRIPADLVIIDSSNLLIDESIITGESKPLKKNNFTDFSKREFSDHYLAFSGTMIISGWLIGIVHKTGAHTKIGQIGKSLSHLADEEPQVKKEINQIVFKLAILCLVVCAIVFLLVFLKTQNIITASLSSISLAIALVPEELPIVLTIFLALSSVRLSKSGLIIKNKAIVETLGATNVICVDKTGTLTQNNLKLKKIIINNQELDLDNLKLNEEVTELLKASYLATYFNSKDKTDLEIVSVFKKTDSKIPKMETLAEGVINQSFVFSKKYLFKKSYYTFAKGAYEEISKICRISSKYEDFYLNKIEELSGIGYRIIAVAVKKEKNIQGTKKFELLGLLAFQDEIREDAKEYIKICQENNIRVCMITGDYKNTAIYFAKELQINNPLEVLTGNDFEKLSLKNLKEKIEHTNIFARVTPKQKLTIVNLLKSQKNIVAMTGDGVNDVLALKSANVGISIGEGGSDIAKEASDVILIQNNLSNIVKGIVEGRRVYKNLGITGRYIYSFHLPIILIALINNFLQLPQLLLPVHIALLEFIIDPFSTLVFESIPANKNSLAEKPRQGKFRLIENINLGLGSIYGVTMFLLVFIPFYLLHLNGYENATGVSLVNILGLNIVLIILNFTKSLKFKEVLKNRRFIFAMLILLLVFILALISFKVDLIGLIVIFGASILFYLLKYIS
jgi:Ca2+-transporting ATPase